MLALAGLVAERVMGLADAASLAASRSDLEVATRIATLTVGGARADKAIAHHLAVVERMLRKREPILRDLAEALYEKGRLSGSEVTELVPRR